MRKSITEMTVCAAFCAVLCVTCPFTVPVGAVPVTLATFAVYCIGGAAGFRRSLIAVGLYLLIGAVGVPVFAGFRGGIACLVGPTGGFLLGYLLLAAVVGLVSDRTDSRVALCAAFCGGTVLLYLAGTLMYTYTAHVSFAAAVWTAVLPFLVFDAVKIAVATALAPKLKKALHSMKN